MADPAKKLVRKEFNQQLIKKLGEPLSPLDIWELGIKTLKYDLYEDDLEGALLHVPEEEEEVTSETGDNYIGTEVSLPKGQTMHSGKVVRGAR